MEMEGPLRKYNHDGNFIVDKKNKDTIRKPPARCSGKRSGFIVFFFRIDSTVNNRNNRKNRRLLVIFGLPWPNLSHLIRMPKLIHDTDDSTKRKLLHFINFRREKISKIRNMFFFWHIFFYP